MSPTMKSGIFINGEEIVGGTILHDTYAPYMKGKRIEVKYINGAFVMVWDDRKALIYDNYPRPSRTNHPRFEKRYTIVHER